MSAVRSRVFILTLVLAVPAVAAQQSGPQTSAPSSSAKKKAGVTGTKSTSTTKKKTAAKKKHVTPIRVRRVKRAFVASADLKPMARQLLQDRTPAGYAGVEKYARSHNDEAGSLAWLVAGYAHVLDRQYSAAIEPLKNARAHAGELGDYVDYYLASAYAGAGDFAHAAATLQGFQAKYPDSLLERDATVVYANALLSTGQERQAITLLEAQRTPTHADLELVLGRAYSAAGQPVKAVQTLRRIYYTMPLAAEAADAELLLKPLASVPGVPPVTFQEQKTRAGLLAQARRHTEAIVEYRALVRQAPAEESAAMQITLAAALYHGGRRYETQQTLASLPPMSGEPDAQRQYLLLEMERPDAARVEQTLSSLRGSYPHSPWFEESLYSAANLYLLRPDYEHAAALYGEMAQRFPAGKYAAYAHWKAAWLNFRLGRNEEAKRLFEKQVELYPTSNQVVPSLYWRGRMAEDEHDYARARAYYRKIQDRFRYYYYADVARTRLRGLAPSSDPVSDPWLDHIPALRPLAGLAQSELPSDDLRAQKSLLLENGALYELALRELQAANSNGDAPWTLAQIAHLYQEQDRYDRALQTLKRAVPGYFGLEIEQMPRPVWEALFPRPWWSAVKKYAVENQLDPYLVAALIRQESEFNPAAVSRADAIGLMQLLPVTGKRMAHELKVRRYSIGMLVEPGVNVQLGTRYFRQLVQKFDGNLEFALAAYNAGADRVEEWRSSGNFREPAEFVESIPFTETREYVQAILRNAGIYHRLYGTP
ncbi:MAG TPA: transglycosylase SLT domain-containing protein [Terriglobales bacterium]|nr:transglycosylase SLT domain-containing protein [Terriglobales bacterium]